MSIYTGYIYLWYDTKAKFFYLGGHKGTVEDSYICSNKMMMHAYKKRPKTFRFKVLQYVYGGLDDLRNAEQRWLDMIKDTELYWTQNIYNKTVRYYNQKKLSRGGNGSANKGKKHSPESIQNMSNARKGKTPWNKGRTGLQIGWGKGIKRISNGGMLGKNHSSESIKKMSNARKGKTPCNAKVWKITEPNGIIHYTERSNIFCKEHGLSWSTLYLSWKKNRPVNRGPLKGYIVELVDSVSRLN